MKLYFEKRLFCVACFADCEFGCDRDHDPVLEIRRSGRLVAVPKKKFPRMNLAIKLWQEQTCYDSQIDFRTK